MKRTALVSVALMLAAGSAGAQGLTMQMGNGWSFSFAGNVNAFAIFTHVGTCSGNGFPCGYIVSPSDQKDVFRETTGLLPAFATFEAKGKEGDVDLGVHFGFAPQIQNIDRLHDVFSGTFSNIQAGAQIDMRQVYLTAGGSWGQILAGRELGVFLRQNILTDHTLFGVGLSTGANAGGTTLGHIGTGYVYPNFVPQITYSTPATNPAQFTIGLFSPNVIDGRFNTTKTPRVEAEVTWTGHFGAAAAKDANMAAGADKIMLWANGMWQHTDTNQVADGSALGLRAGVRQPLLNRTPLFGISVAAPDKIDSWGLGGGAKVDIAGFWAAGSGYYGKGIGDILMFLNAVDATENATSSYGFLGQAGYAFPNTKWSVAGSYGESDVKQSSDAKNAGFDPNKGTNRSIVGDLTYQWTKSIRWVFEYTWGQSKWTDVDGDAEKIQSNQGAVGLMLFF